MEEGEHPASQFDQVDIRGPPSRDTTQVVWTAGGRESLNSTWHNAMDPQQRSNIPEDEMRSRVIHSDDQECHHGNDYPGGSGDRYMDQEDDNAEDVFDDHGSYVGRC
jgi:hypothetical protein